VGEMSRAESRGFLDYYGKYRIVPVSQDHVPVEVYRRQRIQLYRRLGLHHLCFRGSRVLEIGPGTGNNAEVILTLQPASLHLLDANPASVEAIRRRFGDGSLERERTSIVMADFHHDNSELGTFDIVLAEGCLPFQFDPPRSLDSVARFVSGGGGVLVVTCCEHLGILPEICRRLLKPALTTLGAGDFTESVRLAASYFAPDLDALPALTRTPTDWVIDQIFHPWPDQWELSIDQALDQLHDFDYLGSSPVFNVDWRWYKFVGGTSTTTTESASSQWRRTRLALLDHRISSTEIRSFDAGLTKELQALVVSLDRLVQSAWRGDSYSMISSIRSHMLEIITLMSREPLLAQSSRALSEFYEELPNLIEGNFSGRLPEFRTWWGRGQQYLSLTRGMPRSHED